ncbi:MAG: lysophospholipid acyltransferase family protein [Tannerellaceae bacterium]|nr:lysophospholipid acyltransferase family protein [Tannerellaceae bacterium]MCD8264712.1 lysophospholipid acyltransferase family protein [Tannerellaceae bacterium]
MLGNIGYGLLFIWVKLHALLPLKVLYVLSDILYVIIYKVIRYRRKVIRKNLVNSFPHKSAIDIVRIEKAFYHHFTDYIVETIKLAHISEEEISKRAYVKNPELAVKLQQEGHPCIVILMGHYGNWEWFSSAGLVLPTFQIYQIYRPLSNKAFDRLFIYLRTRFKSVGMRKNNTVREVFQLSKNKVDSLVIFIADQTPNKTNLNYWTTFLNQDTAIFNGPERIARKQKLPVIFLDVRKVKRGYYTVELKLLTENAGNTAENEITERYARLMEESIERNPAYWLWTHNRWKYKREDAI